MKANEAPEQIILSADRDTQIIYDDWVIKDLTDNIKIEYIRKDAFIEKALKWYCLDCECNDNCKDTKCFFHNAYKRYLEGDTNSLPPKFSNTILNEDGSTSDNWRYRHFTSRMQNAFIEKVCEWLEENADMFETFDSETKTYYMDKNAMIEDFKKAMKL